MSATTEPHDDEPVLPFQLLRRPGTIGSYLTEVDAVELQMVWLDAVDAYRRHDQDALNNLLLGWGLPEGEKYRRAALMAVLGALMCAEQQAFLVGRRLGVLGQCTQHPECIAAGRQMAYVLAVPVVTDEMLARMPPAMRELATNQRVASQAQLLACNGEFESMSALLSGRMNVRHPSCSQVLGFLVRDFAALQAENEARRARGVS